MVQFSLAVFIFHICIQIPRIHRRLCEMRILSSCYLAPKVNKYTLNFQTIQLNLLMNFIRHDNLSIDDLACNLRPTLYTFEQLDRNVFKAKICDLRHIQIKPYRVF